MVPVWYHQKCCVGPHKKDTGKTGGEFLTIAICNCSKGVQQCHRLTGSATLPPATGEGTRVPGSTEQGERARACLSTVMLAPVRLRWVAMPELGRRSKHGPSPTRLVLDQQIHQHATRFRTPCIFVHRPAAHRSPIWTSCHGMSGSSSST